MTRMTGPFRIVAAVLCLTLGNAYAAGDAQPHPSPEAVSDQPQPSTKEDAHNASSTSKKSSATHEEPECD